MKIIEIMNHSMEPTLKEHDLVLIKNKIPKNGDIIVYSYNNEYRVKRIQAGPGDITELGQLKENEYFVVGDNTKHSEDSRHHGPILKENIIGVVFFGLWPLKRIK